MILTFNEEPNIGRCLEQLKWIERVVVLDSMSSDRTIEIARGFSNVELMQHEFQTFATQCNFGLTQMETEWVLSLDADYILSEDLIVEIKTLEPGPGTTGYSGCFRYCISGRPLRQTLYPPRTILYQKKFATYRDVGHGHRVVVAGKIDNLVHPIFHDDRKSLSRWIESQSKYSIIESEYLGATPPAQLNLPDRLRKFLFLAPIVVPIYLLFLKGLVFDGWRGWYYVWQRTIAELMLSLRLLERKLGGF